MLDTYYSDRRARSFGAQLVVGSATVASRMRLVHFAKVERSVSSVEDTLNVVGIEEKSVFLPAKVRQGWIRPEMAVQEGWFAVREIDFPGCVNHFRLICA